MDQQTPASNTNWYSRMTWLSAFSFALLWSLGDFVFWVFLGLTCSFAFLWVYHSGTRISFTRPGPPPGQAYSGYRTRTEQGSAPVEVPKRVPRVAVILVLIFASVMLFVYRVGKIATNSPEDAESITLEDTESKPMTKNDSLVLKLSDKGNTALNKEAYDSAIYYYKTALKLSPTDPDINYNLAVVYSTRSEYPNSNTFARKCVRYQPDYNYGWWLLGWNYYSMNMYDSAMAVLDKGYANQFDNPGFLRLIGDVSLKMNNRKRAIDMYKASLKQDSTTVELYETLAGLEPDKADWYRRKADAFRK